MEHRKDCAGPREMLDDSTLQRFLNDMAEEKETARTGCGCGRETPPRQPSRTPVCPESTGTCGCAGRNHSSAQYCSSSVCGCRENAGCRSARTVPPLQGLPLAMVYSPEQDWENILEAEEALEKGTLFAGLVFPWYPSRCRENKECGCGRG